MSETRLGIRVRTPFSGKNKEKLMKAANGYLTQPVHVTLAVELLDPSDATFETISDEITVAIVDVDHKTEDGSMVMVHAITVDGSKSIKSVPVPSNGNADDEVQILCNGDDLAMTVDTVYGDAAIIRIADKADKTVDLDDLSSILCRLALPEGFPASTGDPITWEDFTSNPADNDDGGGSQDS